MGPTTDPGRSRKSKLPPELGVAEKSRLQSSSEGLDEPDGTTLIDGIQAPKSGSEPSTDSGEEATLRREASTSNDLLPLRRALLELEGSMEAEANENLRGLETLRDQEEALQEQLEHLYLELGNVQDALVGNAAELKTALEHRRTVAAKRYEEQSSLIQQLLLSDAGELTDRERLWKTRVDDTEARFRAFKENPELAEELEAFRRLDERMETLELLPESYRGVVQQHHAELEKRLKPHLEEPVYEAPSMLQLGIAASVSDGKPDDSADDSELRARLILALPVDFKSFERARQGKPDLTARFTFRILAALSRFVVSTGGKGEPEPRDLNGVLGIELNCTKLNAPMSGQELASVLLESFIEAEDDQLAKVHVSTNLVFVPERALQLLWSKGSEPKSSSKGSSRGKTKSRSRAK